jgi:SagB-type dehydrogenase family enzyme
MNFDETGGGRKMFIRCRLTAKFVAVILLLFPAVALAQDLKTIKLLKPQMDSSRMLMQVLKDRKTSRNFSPKKLPIRVLSNILWAACGVNRPQTNGRTAPSANNWQEIDIYVASANGLYLYDAVTHSLKMLLNQDIRDFIGSKPYIKEAPVNLIYVADLSRMGNATPDEKDFYSATDTGFISQNVYLYCASEGLATVVRGNIDREALGKAMKLRDDQRIILEQTIGYPRQ